MSQSAAMLHQSRGSYHNHSLPEIIQISDDSHHSTSSDSDGPVNGSKGNTPSLTAAKRRNRRIHDSDDEDEVLPPPQSESDQEANNSVIVPAPATARQKMHEIFARFAGCQHRIMQVEPAPAPDADMMDLRSAVPETFPLQFLELESAHVPADSDDSSGSTNSDSDSDVASLIDDSKIMSSADIEYLARYVAKALPLTSKLLASPPPLLSKSPRKKRVVSSSSTSPPAA
jgi:hypothetical protein